MKNNYVQPVLVEIMTVHELASFLKTSDAKVNRLARTGDIPAFRIGKSWLFWKGMIELWIREKTNSCQHELNSQVQHLERRYEPGRPATDHTGTGKKFTAIRLKFIPVGALA